ncbi:MAG: response regulator [Chloroflexota bacterium]
MESILVVEDELAVARGLQYALEQEGWQVTVARSGAEALAALGRRVPDLVVLDVRLPDMSGFDVCRRLRQTYTCPVVFLTARDDEVDKVLGLELGADDYITKPFSVRELVARIRALLRRAYGSLAGLPRQEVVRVRDLTIDLVRRRVYKGDRRVELTAIEFELLRVLATHPGVVYSREALMHQVWDEDRYAADPRTVNVHISRVREKIEDDPARPLIVTERGVGYKFADR